MPRKADHRKAQSELAKLPPDALQAITVRLPASSLRNVHEWAEQKNVDLSTALRELVSLGQEAATRPSEQVSPATRIAVKKWSKPIERALREGRSPIEPLLLAQEDPSQCIEVLPIILAGIDYRSVIQGMKERRDQDEPWIDRVWKSKKAAASKPVQGLMTALDGLEENFLARKKMPVVEWSEGDEHRILWLLAAPVMEQLCEGSSDGLDVEKVRPLISAFDAENIEKVRQMITARYLFCENRSQPWSLTWDD